jgi:multidrug efflux pump subunit AcrA (membrane-fusion protein)
VAAGLAVQHRNVTARTEPPSRVSPAIPVVAAKVERGDVPIYLTGVGTVAAYNTVVVRSQIQGQITEINFKEGQTVHAGDQLALIDPTPYQAQVDQMIAARAGIRPNLGSPGTISTATANCSTRDGRRSSWPTPRSRKWRNFRTPSKATMP